MPSPRAAITLVIADNRGDRSIRIVGATRLASSDVAGAVVCVAESGKHMNLTQHTKNALFVVVDEAEPVGCDVLVVDGRTKGPPNRAAAAVIDALCARMPQETVQYAHASNNENAMQHSLAAAAATCTPAVGLVVGPGADPAAIGGALVDVMRDALHCGSERRPWAWQNPLADPPVRYAMPMKAAPAARGHVEFVVLALLSAFAWMAFGVYTNEFVR